MHAVKHRPELAGEELAEFLICHGLLVALLVVEAHHLVVVEVGLLIASLQRCCFCVC